MNRIIQVLIVIAIVIASAQICAITVELLTPPEEYDTTSLEMETARRWQVYWFSGLPLLGLGLWLRRRHPLPGDALSIAGVNLMLVGNNGGLYSIGYEAPRLTTAVITLLLLVGMALAASKNSWR